MTGWIILAIVAAVAIYAIYVFNRLVSLRQLANEGWSGIDVQLKRRSDLVPNLVDSVKGYAVARAQRARRGHRAARAGAQRAGR